MLVPAPAKLFIAVFKSLTSVQLVPFQVSVTVLVDGDPPKANAAVLVAPAAPNSCLAVFKSLTSVQLVPL